MVLKIIKVKSIIPVANSDAFNYPFYCLFISQSCNLVFQLFPFAGKSPDRNENHSKSGTTNILYAADSEESDFETPGK